MKYTRYRRKDVKVECRETLHFFVENQTKYECINCESRAILLKKELISLKEKKEKKISREDIANMDQEEKLKYEIAEELGLLDKVIEGGWRSLSSKETGRIGGIISKKKKRFR